MSEKYMRGAKKRLGMSVYLVCCLLLAACGGNAPPGTSSSPAGQQHTSHSGAAAAAQSLLFESDGTAIVLTTGQALAGDAASMTRELSIGGAVAFFTIERQGAAGLRLAGAAGDAGQEFTEDMAGAIPQAFDEFGDIREGFVAQITAIDLDKDGVQETVVSLGDGQQAMRTAVYRYVGGETPFALAGVAAGETVMRWQNGQLQVPYGEGETQDIFVYEAGVLKVWSPATSAPPE